ncbi:MAG: ABC transporter permease [Vulcanisaeta sp.]|nr:ABC transporter permease [Vulcanisaeta sp.]
MRVGDYFRLSWRAVWERRGRAIGAIVGIIIAILALGLAVGFGQGYRALTTSFFTRVFGTNTVFLIPGQSSELTITDVLTIERLPHVINAVPILGISARVYVNGQEHVVTIMGVTTQELEQLYGVTSINNALLSGYPVLGPGLVLVGYDVAFTSTGQQVIYPGQVVVLNVNGRNLIVTVSGVLQQSAIALAGVNPNNVVFMDENTFLSQLDPSGVVAGVIVYVDNPNNVNYVTNELEALFPMDRVLNLSTLLSSLNQFFTVLEVFLAFVSGISFVIIGIWIFDTMMLNVIQRTREFGIMRAVGFSSRSIPLLLIMEALIMALMGSVIGITLLAVVAHLLPSPSTVMAGGAGRFGGPFRFSSSAIQLPFELTPLDYALLFLLPIAINIIAALAPAIRAMRIPPAQTLRYE